MSFEDSGLLEHDTVSLSEFLIFFIVISACKTHYTIPVHTIVFLKMNPRF